MNTDKLWNKKESRRLTVAFWGVFLHLLMCPVWQGLSFVKRTVLCCFYYSYDSGEEAPLQPLRLRLWALEQRRTWVGASERAPFWRHACRGTCFNFGGKPAEHVPICLPNAWWRLPQFSEGSDDKRWNAKKGDRSIKPQLSTFRRQHSLEVTTSSEPPTFPLTSNTTSDLLP